MSFLSVLLFFAIIISLGLIDTGNQTYYEILRNVFAGQYLFFTVPVFIFAFFIFGGHQYGWRSTMARLIIIQVVSIALYMGITSFLLTKLNGQ